MNDEHMNESEIIPRACVACPNLYITGELLNLYELVFAGLVIVRALELVGAWWLS